MRPHRHSQLLSGTLNHLPVIICHTLSVSRMHVCVVLQSLAGEEASTIRDFMPTARLMFRCFMSKPG